MNVYALQTVKKESRIKKKNFLLVNNIPLWRYNYHAAANAKMVKGVYVSTDATGDQFAGVDVIRRPPEISGNAGSHIQVIQHGLFEIEKRINKQVDILVVLLGNSNGCTSKLLNKGIRFLIKNPFYSSCISVGQYNMFNPRRAFHYDQGFFTPYNRSEARITKNVSNDRNGFGDFYFFNGSFWICRRQCIIDCDGSSAFPWLGGNIHPIVQPPEIMELDEMWQLPHLGRVNLVK